MKNDKNEKMKYPQNIIQKTINSKQIEKRKNATS